MHERVILAFLARPSDYKKDDDELLSMLESPLAKAVGKVLTHPEETPATEKISRLAERLFLDARNYISADQVRQHHAKLPSIDTSRKPCL